ncbi:filamentation induced by cAMP protein Fic [Anaeromyxobacter dehalogenans 2CP-1]|uniref:Filamentation induced by cAMP protein Fic n=1 Tax=Anaeromyxobacter dehalogenans (strain ATCC BAA-258 / DSM 21875 / 2CP-1) TaxID=455488 RepID=B8JC28_ANAD2|nr:Fic family protein [Anaeromyxobacter dehalogenans]ACL63950.1 filamentation induced by cAMP protein Fic [Anaeromyxobacter dehalogenans 2CP-1]
MARYETRSWPADPSAPGGRAERRAFRYRVFFPDPIAKLQPALPSGVAAAVSVSERAVDALNRDPPRLASLEVLARRLLRAESVASSRIEGLVLSQRRLARAEAEAPDARDETARSVLGNVAAMEHAVALGAAAKPLRLHDLLEIHRHLMLATNTPEIAGRIRDRQNWIGGNAFNPGRADFVPPAPERVKALMEDLVAFMNRTDLPPVVQAAIAHAQFETIHPFADGNGRVGRALIHVMLRRRGLAPRYVPPVSLVLAADAKAYIGGLTAFREDRPADWILSFAEAIERASAKASDLALRLAELQERWRERAGRPRRHSSAEALIVELPAHPIVTVATAQKFLDRSKQAVNEAIATLAEKGILHAITLAKRNRAWEARDLFDLINDFEHDLAIPTDDDEPSRPSPRRKTTSKT